MKTHPMTTITLFDDKGRKWNVRLVRSGEQVFADSRQPRTAKEEGGDLLQFYDGEQDPKKFGPLGQFVSQYLLATLYRDWPIRGINLCGHQPQWRVDAAVMMQIDRWLGHIGAHANAPAPKTTEQAARQLEVAQNDFIGAAQEILSPSAILDRNPEFIKIERSAFDDLETTHATWKKASQTFLNLDPNHWR